MKAIGLFALLGALLLGSGSAAWADPPVRVGRVGDTVGSVWLMPYGTQDWIQAVRNQPVSVQDSIATDPGARAEIDIGSTTVRVGEDSQVRMQQLDDDRIIVDVERGSITSRLRTKQAALSFTAMTNEGKYAPLQPGYYRFDQVPPGSRTTVYEGSVRFDGPDSTLVVSAGQQAEFWREPPASEGGTPGPTNYTLTAPERDAFEQWSALQDQADGRLQQPVYVSPEMPGAADLQQYGQWSDTPEYGAVWTPTTVASGWAPYTDGHWDWVDPWGWTWIDTAAWGFAPFHYGRWVRYRDRWGWAPGAYVPRPVYAPALVGWVGNAPPPRAIRGRGPGPSVGWFPLSPRDAYVPGFKATPGYIRSVNAGHARAIPNLSAIAQNPTLAVQNHQFMNRGVPGAMTVVPASVITDRQPVPGFRGRGAERGQSAADLARAPVRPAAPIGAPPQASPRAGVGPRFAQGGQGGAAPAMAGQPAIPGTPGSFGRPAQPGQPAVPGTPAIPGNAGGFGRAEAPRGAPVPAAPTGMAQAAEQRRYQQQPVPRAERQGFMPPQGQPVPAAPTGAPVANSGDNGTTRFNHAPEFQGQPQIRAPQGQPPRSDQPRFNVPDAGQQARQAQQQQIEQQQQQQRQQQFQMEQQQRQQRAQVEQQQQQQRQQQFQMEQQQRGQRAQVEQQQQMQRQQQMQMEQQQRAQRAQVEQQQQMQRQQQMQMEQQQRAQRAQVEQQQQMQHQQQMQMQMQMQMEQQQRAQRAQVEQQQQVQRQQQMQMQMQQQQQQQQAQQQRQQQAPPPRGEHNRGER